jgi:predicted ABC-type sugar transport system permease subunit
MVSEGSCTIIWTIYFYWISRNAFYFIYFTIFLNILAVIGCFYVVESPRYLFGMEQFEECRKVMMVIAKRNKVSDYEEPTFLDE